MMKDFFVSLKSFAIDNYEALITIGKNQLALAALNLQ
jgi:hypothetical protein